MLPVDVTSALIGGLYRLILVSGIVVSIILMAGLLRQRHLPGAKTVFFLLLSVAQALFCYLALSGSTSPEEGFFWARSRFLGLYMAVPLAYLYVMQFTGAPVRRWLMILLLALPIVMQVLLWEHDWASTFFFLDWRLVQHDGFSFEETSYTAAASAYRIFVYIPALFIVVRLIHFVRISRGLKRQQASWILGALGVAFLAGIPTTFTGVIAGLNLTPLGLAFFAIITAWTFRMRVFSMMPVAYETVLRQMRDSVLVLNTEDESVGNNPAANRLFPQDDLLGQPLKTILPDVSFLQQYDRLEPGAEADLQAVAGHGQHTHEISISPITTPQGDIHGRIVVLHDVEHRKQAEEALRQSESRLRIITENMVDMVIQSDLMGNIIYVSPSVEKILGYSADYWLKLSVDERFASIHPDDVTDFVKATRTPIDTGLPGQVEYRQRTSSGEYIWLESNIQQVQAASEETTSLVITSRNITHRKQTEEALRTGEEQIRRFRDRLEDLHRLNVQLAELDQWDAVTRQIVEGGREILRIDRLALMMENPATGYFVGTFGTNPQGETTDERQYVATYWKDQFAYLAQIDPGMLYREDADLYFNDQVVGRGWNIMAFVVSDKHPAGLLFADNLITGRPFTPDDRALFGLFMTLTDSALMRQHMLDTLRESKEKYRLIAENTSDGIAIWDETVQRITYASPAYDRLLGREPGTTTNRMQSDLFEMIHPDDRTATNSQFEDAIRQHQSSLTLAYRALHQDGRYLWKEDRLTLNFDEDRRYTGSYIISRDISERKLGEQRQLELALERERADILTHFIEEASHEFRTPLSIINTTSSLMVRLEDVERRRTKSETIEQQVMRINKLIRILLVLTRLRTQASIQHAPIDIQHMIRAECQSMARKYGAAPRLEQNAANPLPIVHGSEDDLADAFQQVLDNAYRYTPPEGTITVTSSSDTTHLWIEVRDTGIGISAESLPHIFETFWREDKSHTTPGFGLGLPIAQRVMELHQGQITVESQVGEGTTVRITLPLQLPAA